MSTYQPCSLAHLAFPLPLMRTMSESDADARVVGGPFHVCARLVPKSCMNRPSTLSVCLPPTERRSARPLAHHYPSSVLRSLSPSSGPRGEKAVVVVAFIARHGSVCAMAAGGRQRPQPPAHGPTSALARSDGGGSEWGKYPPCRRSRRRRRAAAVPCRYAAARGRWSRGRTLGERRRKRLHSFLLRSFLPFFLPSKFSPFEARDVRSFVLSFIQCRSSLAPSLLTRRSVAIGKRPARPRRSGGRRDLCCQVVDFIWTGTESSPKNKNKPDSSLCRTVASAF